MVGNFRQTQNLSGLSLAQGRYQLESLLTTGSMGTLYVANDRHIDAKVGIRVISSHLAQDPQFALRYLQSARASILFPHPSLVRIFDFGATDNLVFVAMELMPTPNLADMYSEWRRDQRWLALDEAFYLIQRAGEALAYVRRHGLPTRRLKPSQLMFRTEAYTVPASRFAYLPVLVDFAIDLFTNPLSEAEWMSSLAYIAPEIIFRQGVDERSDIYMLGAFAWELVMGKPLLEASTSTEALNFHLSRGRPDVRVLHPTLPEPVAAWLEKALAHSPDQRFTTLRAMLETLASIPGGMIHAVLPPNFTVAQISAGKLRYPPETLDIESGAIPVANAAWLPQQALPPELNQRSVHSSANMGQSIVPPSTVPPSIAPPSLVSPVQVRQVTAASPPAPLRLQVQSQRQGDRIFELTKGPLTIGRHEDNDVVLNEPRVSRKHARLEFEGGVYYLVDLDSANGTLVGETTVPRGERVIWPPDLVVKMGESRLRLIGPGEGLERPVSMAAHAPVQSTNSDPATPYGLSKTEESRHVDARRNSLTLEQERFQVEPGVRLRIPIVVSNAQSVTESLTLAVTGVPGTWLTFPSSVTLAANSKERIYLELQPPRLPQTVATLYPVQIVATSQSSSESVVQVQLQVEIISYSQLRVELQPVNVNEGETMRVIVENQGNDLQVLKCMWWDESPRELEFWPPEAELSVQPGQVGFIEFSASGQKTGWRASSKNIMVQVNPQFGQTQLCQGTVTRRGFIRNRL